MTAPPANDRDWFAWHLDYDDPDSALSHRLRIVREQVWNALDEAPPGPLRIVSMVAGQGRDLLPVLAAHPRRDDVTARLVELDPRNADVARATAAAARLADVDVLTADAAVLDYYRHFVPADIVLICGLFGNISDTDIRHVIAHAGSLTRRGGVVIWTRYRGEDDAFPRIDGWFAEAGFRSTYASDPALMFGVGVNRAERDSTPIVPGTRLFTFVGH